MEHMHESITYADACTGIKNRQQQQTLPRTLDPSRAVITVELYVLLELHPIAAVTFELAPKLKV